MTVNQVKARVRDISAMAGDDETAHSAEDKLRRDVLTAIAAGAEEPERLAYQALVTEGFDFERWCA